MARVSARGVKARERRVWVSYWRCGGVRSQARLRYWGVSGGWRLCDTAIKCGGCHSCRVG